MELTRAALAHDSSVQANVSTGESIRKFVLEHGIQVAPIAPTPLAAKPAPIKCLVYMAAGTPLLVILRAQDRVLERAVAANLGLAKRKVALAPAAQLVSLTGFPVGSIPPFGHIRPLNTMVDALVCQHYTHVEFGDDREWIISVEELLRVTGATTLALSDTATNSMLEHRHQAPLRSMPVPWPAEATHVSLECMVAQKRKIANLLVFLNVIPLSREPPPKPGTAAYLRRLWSHPQGGCPCEVQLILGKTLERNMGREGASELFKKLRAGDVISFSGRPQEQRGSKSDLWDGANNNTSRPYVLDVVVDALHIASQTLIPTQKETTAGDKEAESDSAPSNIKDSSFARKRGRNTGVGKKKQFTADRLYQHAIQEGSIKVVDTIEGVLAMRSIILAKTMSLQLHNTQLINQSDGLVYNNSTFGVVGLDAEWRPTSREEPFTPVSILQIGTPTHVFLVDVLKLLNSTDQSSSNRRVIEVLSDTLAELLGDPLIYKVGFGLRYDMKRLIESYPWLPCFSSGDKGVKQLRSHVDIQLLARAAADGPKTSSHYKRMGLSSLCEHVLGAGLDKEEQRSDWGTRPLSSQQIKYAAADVCCLVDMFIKLTSRCPDLLSEKRMKQLDTSLNLSISPDFRSDIDSRRKNTSRPSSSHVTRDVKCYIENLVPFLGTTVHGSRDKADIVRLASIPTDGDVFWSGSCPRFSRASGIVEFANDTFMLFINVPSKGYPNAFTVTTRAADEGGDGGDATVCEMTWWPGKGQTMKHPVIRRLLRIGDAGGGGGGDRPTVLLFCRPNERGAGGYVFCGRLSISALDSRKNSYGETSDLLCSQLRVTWRLDDFPSVLCHSQEFFRLLDLQLLS